MLNKNKFILIVFSLSFNLFGQLGTGNFNIQLGGDIDGSAQADFFGYSVSLSDDGSILAVGTPYNDDNGAYSGQTRIYKLSQFGDWVQMGNDINGAPPTYLPGVSGAVYDYSGFSVNLSGDGLTVAIGAPGYSNIGRVLIYRLSNGTWSASGLLLGSSSNQGYKGRFGESVSLSLSPSPNVCEPP